MDLLPPREKVCLTPVPIVLGILLCFFALNVPIIIAGRAVLSVGIGIYSQRMEVLHRAIVRAGTLSGISLVIPETPAYLIFSGGVEKAGSTLKNLRGSENVGSELRKI
ncbi:hypothetical protein LguiA_003821 [Lonicera macranthoides]